ncbi:UNVERIFIED_CONTAM: hypothetical protein Sangu_2524300 [Sesamum angustifolium]|uniref:Uncharacterized protein n=1 Tax=Sesamum angustifolium TaxID=2727405 RepID=A0AAW2JGF9_9LAMI
MKRSPPPEATIDSVVGDLSKEGAQEPKEGDTPIAIDEGLPDVYATASLLDDQTEAKEDPACGDDKEKM